MVYWLHIMILVYIEEISFWTLVLNCGFHVLVYDNSNYIAQTTRIGFQNRVAWPDSSLTVIRNLRAQNRSIWSSSDTRVILWSRILEHICCGTCLNVSPLFDSQPMIYCRKLLDRCRKMKKAVVLMSLLCFCCLLFPYCSFWNGI